MSYNPQIHHRRSIRLKGYDYSQAGLYFVTICCDDMKHRFGTIENNEMVLNEFGMVAYNEWAKLPERFTNFELDVFQIMPNHMHGIIALVGAGFTPTQNDDANHVGAGFTPAHDVQPFSGNDAEPVFGNDAERVFGNDVQSVSGNDVQWVSGNDAETISGNDAETISGNDVQRVAGNDGSPVSGNDGQSVLGNDDGAPARRAPARGAPTAATVGDIVGVYKSLVANECLKIWKLKWAGVNPAPYMGKLWQRNYHEHIIRNEQSYQTISNYIINNPGKWKDDKFYKE